MSNSPKVTMPEDQKKKCHTIIHAAAVSAGGAGTGLAQIPLADSTIITPIQIGMIVALGKVFDQKITEAAAKAIISGMAASFAGRAASQLLIGWIPVLGNTVNTATAAGLTELVGWTAAEQFYQKQLNGMGVQPTEETEPSVYYYANHPDEVSAKQEDSSVTQLKKRANEFFTGRKTVENDKSEYRSLLNDIETELDTGDNALRDIWIKLLDKKFLLPKATMTSQPTKTDCKENPDFQHTKSYRADAVCELKLYDVFTTEKENQYRVTAKVNYAPIHVGDVCALIVGEQPTDKTITVLQIGIGDRQWTEKEPDKVTTLIVSSNVEYGSELSNQKFICLKI